MILGFYAGKSHNLIGLGIFHGDLDFFRSLNCPSLHSGQFRDKKSLDLHEKSLDLSNYEIFPHKILKSRTFKKSSILIVKSLDAPKSILETGKTLKILPSGQIYNKKNQKTKKPKNPKKPKKTTGLGFKKKKPVFSNPALSGTSPRTVRYSPEWWR